MKKLMILFITAALLIPLFNINIYAIDEPELSNAACAYLYNITSEKLLFTKNQDVKIAPGPTVKLMTVAVIIDLLREDLERTVTVKREMLRGVSGYNINLQREEELTVNELLHALIVGGANDAAAVLAITAAGSIDAFVLLMNEKAREIGAANTFYTNPSGLDDPEMVTTIADTAKIALYINKHSIFKDIAKLEYYTIRKTNKSRERKIFSKNFFIATNTEYIYHSRYVTGMNAGNTKEAGYCVTATSIYKNSEYLCIVMGAEKDEKYIYSYIEAEKLLQWAYKNFAYMTVLSPAEVICEIPVRLSANMDYVTLMPEEGIDLYLPTDINIAEEVTLSWSLDETELVAPVSEGQIVGLLTVIYNDEIVGRINLVTKSSIARSEPLYLLSLVEALAATAQFRYTIIAVIAFAVFYVLINSVVRYNKAKRKRRKGNNAGKL
ncbi:MAG: D-alanyl-D-alanine carboxypeptidase family protein [Eubacteriales bacterium]